MSYFIETFGPQWGLFLETNWVYILLVLGLFAVMFQFGFGNILFKLSKQVFLMLMMITIGFIWIILFKEHWSKVNLVSVSSAISSNDASEVLKDTKFMNSISEIILITGCSIFVLAILYRQLPIDLIPDFIPCIGDLDNKIAGFLCFLGFIIVLIGVYLQLYYTNTHNTTRATMEAINKNVNFAETFWNEDPQEKTNFLKKTFATLTNKLEVILNQLYDQIQKYVAHENNPQN